MSTIVRPTSADKLAEDLVALKIEKQRLEEILTMRHIKKEDNLHKHYRVRMKALTAVLIFFLLLLVSK